MKWLRLVCSCSLEAMASFWFHRLSEWAEIVQEMKKKISEDASRRSDFVVNRTDGVAPTSCLEAHVYPLSPPSPSSLSPVLFGFRNALQISIRRSLSGSKQEQWGLSNTRSKYESMQKMCQLTRVERFDSLLAEIFFDNSYETIPISCSYIFVLLFLNITHRPQFEP